MSLDKFIADNGFPLIDLNKPQNKWHQLSDEHFKGAFIHKNVDIGAKSLSVVTVYNYRSGVAVTEKFGEGEFSKAELAKIKNILEAQDAEARKERDRQHEQCKTHAHEHLKEFTKVDLSANPYLKRKIPDIGSFDGQYQVYSRKTLLGTTDLIAPIVDIAGILWNYQSITEDGDKQLLIGGKFQSLFIPIFPNGLSVNDLRSFTKVYITEGYSTGLSVYLALEQKYPVLCAVSSTNIFNVVADVRSKYDKISIIICADNDCWKSGQENTGQITAIGTVSRVDGTSYGLPDFSGCNSEQLGTKPTDYNDLHNLRGLNEVRRQIEQILAARPRIIYALGYNQRNYYFTTSKVPQIQTITDFSETDIIRLAPLSYWEARFPKPKGGVDLSQVKNHLIDQCQTAGLFEANRLRGRGLYREDDRLVLHLGDKIKFLDTLEEKDLADMKSAYYYDPRPRWSYAEKTPTETFIKDIHAALSKFAWSHPFEATLCLGWLLTTPMAGCLSWRSHLAITAEAGSGKSTLLQALNSLLAGWLPLKLEGATEASLRQSLGSDAVPVLLDEQDTNSLDVKAFDKIMTLFRMASSEGEVRRGTVSGKAIRFNACFSGLIAGINLPKMKHADLTRFCVIELNPNNKIGSWADMEKEIAILFSKEAGEMLYSWTLKNIAAVSDKIKLASPMVEVLKDARTAQQYSNLIGAAAHALGVDLSVMVKELSSYWEKDTLGGIKDVMKDSEECVDHLMNLIALTDSDRRIQSLGKVLEEVNEPKEILAQFNMRVIDGKLFVPNSNPQLMKHFSNTPWLNWNKALRRVEGSEQRVVKIGGRPVRGLLIQVAAKTPEF